MAYRGEVLRALREQKGIQLRKISDDTRIIMAYLAAIEEERFDRFPGRFYFRSFAGEYARSLGLDPGAVIKDLQSAYDAWYRESEPHASSDEILNGRFFRLLRGTSRTTREI